MAINRSFISTQEISDTKTAVIEIVTARPDTTTAINPPETPRRLVGYYSAESDSVELYVADEAGLRWIRV
jgi:hypothetical protein